MYRQRDSPKSEHRSQLSADLVGGSPSAAVQNGASMHLTPEQRKFERDRLALFARYGFEGESRSINDREGRRTYAIVRGGGSRPIVFVHGGLSEAGQWALLAGRIPGYVVIPDRPGCGSSYTIDYRGMDYRKAAADWLLDVVDGIGAEQVDLVGLSMGGFFSIAFAVEHPERVRRLIFVGAPAGLDRQLPLYLRLWGNPVFGQLISRLRPTDPEVVRNRVYGRLLVAHPEAVPLDILQNSVAASHLPGAALGAYSMLRAVSTLRGWRHHLMMRDDLSRLTIPALFLWGDADAFAPPSSGQDMVTRMPDARIQIIPGAGHVCPLDGPEAIRTIASAIVEFLGKKQDSETGLQRQLTSAGPREDSPRDFIDPDSPNLVIEQEAG